jgi:hypothetical protein
MNGCGCHLEGLSSPTGWEVLLIEALAREALRRQIRQFFGIFSQCNKLGMTLVFCASLSNVKKHKTHYTG